MAQTAAPVTTCLCPCILYASCCVGLVVPCLTCHVFAVTILRPLSKTVRFNVLRVMPQGGSSGKGFSGF